MKNKLKLEEITNLLLQEKISSKEAEDCINREGLRLESTPEIEEDFDDPIFKEENCFRFYDEFGEDKAYLEFKRDSDKSGNFFWLEDTKSYESGKGYFKRLYYELESLAKKEKILCIKLIVNRNNVHAKSIYEHLGFQPVKPTKGYIGEWIEMRKDLTNSE